MKESEKKDLLLLLKSVKNDFLTCYGEMYFYKGDCDDEDEQSLKDLNDTENCLKGIDKAINIVSESLHETN
jgi:hypothetical protein